LLREIDQLDGLHARIADQTALRLHSVRRSLRAAIDCAQWCGAFYRTLTAHPRLELHAGRVVSIGYRAGQFVVSTEVGTTWRASAVVIATGAWLNRVNLRSAGEHQQVTHTLRFQQALTDLSGVQWQTMRNGLPPLIDAHTIDISRLSLQRERLPLDLFSTDDPALWRMQLPSYLIEAPSEVAELWRTWLDFSPATNGTVAAQGPKRCKSADVRIAEGMTRLRIYLEPTGWHTRALFANGLETALPAEQQHQILSLIPGLEHALILRPGYAFIYDALIGPVLDETLCIPTVPGLFFAGQVCGTNGHAESAALGLVAGTNAARFVRDRSPLHLPATEYHIGMLVHQVASLLFRSPQRLKSRPATFMPRNAT
jgi:tRNA uridine 5-carboxymethylaminomethyl modification enzyme